MKRVFLILLFFIFLSGCSSDESLPESTVEYGSTVESSISFADSSQDSNTEILNPEAACDDGSNESVNILSDIDSLFQADHFHLDAYSHYASSSDVFLVCTDAVEMNQGSHYSAIQKVGDSWNQQESRTFQKDISLFGQTFHVEFDFVSVDNSILITYISPDLWNWFLSDTRLGEGYCLLILRCTLDDGDSIDYPVLVNVHTGSVTDFLTGFDHAALPSQYNSDLGNSSTYGMRSAVLLEEYRLISRMNGGVYYFFDTPNHVVYNLNDLCRRRVEGCTVVGNDLVCWNSADGFWKLDLESLTLTQLQLDAEYVEFSNEIWSTKGSSFVLYRDGDLQLHVYDFLTEENYTVAEPEGWSVDGDRCYPSPDGRKLFQFELDEDGVYQLLIFDCDRKRFILLERTNPDSVRESLIEWTGNSDIVITSESMQDFYVYKWKKQVNTVIETEEIQLPQRSDSDFVAVLDYIPDLLVEMKYAKADNFTGHVIYDFQDAYLRYGTVKKLAAVQEELRTIGLGLKLWDGFRPTAAQFKLWEIFPNSTYVANPTKGFSSHSRGNTVDITLVTAGGLEIEMPTEFDDFSAMADRDYSDCTEAAANNAMLLEGIMEKHGFVGYFGEWWHFADSVKYDVEHCFDPSMISPWNTDSLMDMYTAPDSLSDTVARIPAGETVTMLGRDGEFSLIEYFGQRGYVRSDNLQPA